MNRSLSIRLRSLAGSTVRAIRDGWVIAGITLALFAVLEFGYRTQARIRSSPGDTAEEAGPGIAHPHTGEPWFPYGDPRTGGGQHFDAYRGWWPNPENSRYVNVDSAGLRVTPQPVPDAPGLRVFALGGSTMWGFSHIDSLTIPAIMSRFLERQDVRGVEIRNFAQKGYTLTQNLITLMLEIRRGNVPDVAIFLDGSNDIATAWASGRPGMITNEALAAQAFDRARSGLRGNLLGIVRRSALVRRLRIAAGEQPWVLPAAPSPEVCDEIAVYYGNLVKQGIAIGEAFGIDVRFYFQPILATSQKALTPWEDSVKGPALYDDLVRTCATETDRQLAAETGRHYVPLHSIFDADTATVYTDAWGHLTVLGNERVAELMAADIAEARASRALQQNPASRAR